MNDTLPYSSDIELGQRYRDPQTGVEGVATAVAFFQYACERVTIECVIEGKLHEYTFDAPRLENVATKKRASMFKTGGPGSSVHQGPTRTAIPSR